MASLTSTQEVTRFIKSAPDRLRALSGCSSNRNSCGPQNSRSGRGGKTGDIVARLEESLKLLDDAIRLFEDQYRRRCRQQGKKVSKSKMIKEIQRWLSEPTEQDAPNKYFYPRPSSKMRF